jgi:hypothetical protein
MNKQEFLSIAKKCRFPCGPNYIILMDGSVVYGSILANRYECASFEAYDKRHPDYWVELKYAMEQEGTLHQERDTSGIN